MYPYLPIEHNFITPTPERRPLLARSDACNVHGVLLQVSVVGERFTSFRVERREWAGLSIDGFPFSFFHYIFKVLLCRNILRNSIFVLIALFFFCCSHCPVLTFKWRTRVMKTKPRNCVAVDRDNATSEDLLPAHQIGRERGVQCK